MQTIPLVVFLIEVALLAGAFVVCLVGAARNSTIVWRWIFLLRAKKPQTAREPYLALLGGVFRSRSPVQLLRLFFNRPDESLLVVIAGIPGFFLLDVVLFLVFWLPISRFFGAK